MDGFVIGPVAVVGMSLIFNAAVLWIWPVAEVISPTGTRE